MSKEEEFTKMFEVSDKYVSELLAKNIDEIRVTLSNYHEITRLTIKAKMCQLLFSKHINRPKLSEYLLKLIIESKKSDKEVWLNK